MSTPRLGTAATRRPVPCWPLNAPNLFNAGLALREAETSGRLHIDGDRPLALALLEKLTLGPWRPDRPMEQSRNLGRKGRRTTLSAQVSP
jgi:hypothetical protein